MASFEVEKPTGLNTINTKSAEAIRDEVKRDTFLIDKMPEPTREVVVTNEKVVKVNKNQSLRMLLS